MSGQATPGPWQVRTHPIHCPACDPDEVTRWNIYHGDTYIADVMACDGPSVGWDEANARLIAAAPELLDVARLLVNHYDLGLCIERARAAIARATGREE